MKFRGDSSTARAPGTHPETPVKIRRPAPLSNRSRVALRSRPFVAAGPRRLVMSVLTVIAGVSAAFALLRLAVDGPLRAEIAGTFADYLSVTPAERSPAIAIVAIAAALLLGLATHLHARRSR